MTQSAEFNSIRISLASPEQVLQWSYGEVVKPETINYRTLRPEKDGLFCERIFGPTKDWECYCGKYKKIRYKGVICDRCGVEVTRAKVRRERMGHIKLAAPIAHIWFSKGTPCRLGLMLDLSPRNLERVLYFAKYIITFVDQEARNKQIDGLVRQRDEEEQRLKQAEDTAVAELRQRLAVQSKEEVDSQAASDTREREIQEVRNRFGGALRRIYEDIQGKIDDLESIKRRQLLTETEYREMREKVGDVFKAGMGAEAILEILEGINLDELKETLSNEVRTTTGQRRKKAIKRLRVVEAFRKSENKVTWMIMTVLPVLPPELRPMVQLDGGRFATSDLNDLYRRVINRNNRLKRLLDLGAPDIIVRNEKRMLQEAVDALIDNGRHGRAISGSHNHKLKSLSDLLRGKQGRFRQNLLGKRVDYSGRSVIVVGPTLRMDQCGLPKRMALELFKPFVMHRLVLDGLAHNIKSAKRMVERVRPELWDILEDVIKTRLVLLNRAPTLHRLGIQAFQPVLVEGSAIQIHPLVCTAFNADFDGDQMAVHVPLSKEAVMEARNLMLSTHNMLSPSSGEPIVSPTLDIVLGCYYLTQQVPGAKGEGMRFLSQGEVRLAYDTEHVDLQAEVLVKDAQEPDGWLRTTAGRIIFSAEVLPPEMDFRKYNKQMDDKALTELVADCYQLLGNQGTAPIMDAMKNVGFHYATQSGITISITDIQVPAKKTELMDDADKRITELEEQFQMGLITDDERYRKTVEIWTNTGERMTEAVREAMPGYGGVYMMSVSGAKGNLAQIKQMAGMRGLMSNPHGRIIDLPIKSSFREGLTVLEYFISTHGARKGLTDTALRTADSGYLTRRLIDISQDVIIVTDDCGITNGYWIEEDKESSLIPSLDKRVLGRIAAAPVAHPQTGEILVERNQEIDEAKAKAIAAAGVVSVYARSPLTCGCPRGICRLCYGRSMATGKSILIGEAVGIIAAQSIGEPGTQLTMRTFHTGGIAGESDITTGLPRVEELFEARTPKGMAILAEIDGKVEVEQGAEGRRVRVISQEEFTEEYPLAEGFSPAVESGDQVEVGDTIAWPPATEGDSLEDDVIVPTPIVARVSGRADVYENSIIVSWTETDQREYSSIPIAAQVVVVHGRVIKAGDAITAGPKSPQDILRVMGPEAVQRYLVAEVQAVYRNQGITINDKHIEIIVRQMLRKVRAETSGDTNLLPGELVDRFTFAQTNARILAEGGEPATARPELLGVTRASLNTESFLAAASFQETTRVLTEAAVNGASDLLLGLKENVIIGRLIPARLDVTAEGRKRLGIPEPGQQRAAVSVLEGPGDGDSAGLEAFIITEAMPTTIDLGEDNPLLSHEDEGIGAEKE